MSRTPGEIAAEKALAVGGAVGGYGDELNRWLRRLLNEPESLSDRDLKTIERLLDEAEAETAARIAEIDQ